MAVVGIGLLMYPVLKQVHPALALWYPILRIVECLVSAACGVYLLAASEVVPNHLLWVYVPTGIGGIILSYLLLVSRLVPRPIALLGLIGYASLTIGVPLDLLGVLDMSAGAGMLLVVPGGLFELVFLPIWLIAKGFRTPPSTADLDSPVLLTAADRSPNGRLNTPSVPDQEEQGLGRVQPAEPGRGAGGTRPAGRRR